MNRPIDFFLVRHGEASSRWAEHADPGLSDLGRSQAQEAAQALHACLPAGVALVTSPLARARETAEPLATLLGRTVQVDAAFSEAPSPVPLGERGSWLQGFMESTWPAQPAPLKTWRAALLKRLLCYSGDAVVFTHFLVINAVVGHIRGQSATVCCQPDNASITRLRRRGDLLELVELGRELKTHVG